MAERTDASVPKWPDNRPPLTPEEGFKEYREKINYVIKRLEGRIKALEDGAVLEVKEDCSVQKLDRIIELLESFKVPVVIHVTNPPNPIWPYNPIYPGCGCNHEARELMHPDLGPIVTYSDGPIEINPQRYDP